MRKTVISSEKTVYSNYYMIEILSVKFNIQFSLTVTTKEIKNKHYNNNYKTYNINNIKIHKNKVKQNIRLKNYILTIKN